MYANGAEDKATHKAWPSPQHGNHAASERPDKRRRDKELAFDRRPGNIRALSFIGSATMPTLDQGLTQLMEQASQIRFRQQPKPWPSNL